MNRENSVDNTRTGSSVAYPLVVIVDVLVPINIFFVTSPRISSEAF